MNQTQKYEFLSFTLGTLRGQILAMRDDSYSEEGKKKLNNLLELIEDAVKRVYLTNSQPLMGIHFQTEEN